MDNTFIFVTFEFEGFHRWPDAPDEVAFLRDRHRHMFKVRAEIEVNHDDRDIEFILEKRRLEKLYITGEEANNKSCEMLAREIVTNIVGFHGERKVKVEVSEDGENGAVLIHE